MPAIYNNFSPWADTPLNDNYLDIFSIRTVSADSDDILYTVQPQYNYRPDLLAFDLYGDAGLWWVFTQRNMDVLQDPIFDLTAGKQIYLPKLSSLTELLGI